MQTLVFHKQRGGRFRWITVSTMMLAIGTILHLVSPSIAGVTPNWTIATYCVAILLTRPTYRQCLGIGLVAALVNLLTSKSGFPYGNLISEPIGAMMAALVTMYFPELKIGKFSLKPIVCGFLATVMSGLSFVTILTYMLSISWNVYFKGMVPAVFLVSLGNAIVTPLIYLPARRLFDSRGLLPSTTAGDGSDHSGLSLKPLHPASLNVENLTYYYPQASQPAIQDINLQIEKGEFVVVTGPAGSGKTTLAMSLIGAIPHYYGGTMKGMVYVDGMATTQHSIADLAVRVGTILADYDAQLVTMTVGEEMAFSLENRGFSATEIERRSAEALAKVGLAGMETRATSQLSGGQRQRLVIASVLATEPSILVFDEPTSALDPEGIQSFYELVGELNRRDGITVVVVEHRLEAVALLADRVVLMKDGQILADGSLEDVFTLMYTQDVHRAAVPEVYAARLEVAQAGGGPLTTYKNAREELLNMARARRE